MIGWGSWSQRHRGRIRSPIPEQKFFHISTTRKPGDEYSCPPGRHRPARCGQPQSHWRIANWLGLVEPGLPGKDIGSHPRIIILQYSYDSNKPGTKTTISLVDTAPHGVETPTPLRLIADCLWRWWSPSPSGDDVRSNLPMINPPIHLQPEVTGDENGDPPGRHLPTRCSQTNS